MGIYTNFSLNEGTSTDYTAVEPFKGEHFNYHELGIIAAAESAANQNSFMKALALSELASVEQCGTTDVFYEGVNVKGILDKIKAFFKKLIEKIHKIFHTFIAKLSAWFGNSADFAKKYEKEIIKNWSKVSSDWEFKGYKYTNIDFTKTAAQADTQTTKDDIKSIVDAVKGNATAAVAAQVTTAVTTGVLPAFTASNAEELNNGVKAIREKLDDIKDKLRAMVVSDVSGKSVTALDASEFNEELFKAFRDGEDSKQDLKKNDVLTCYGGSINSMMTFLKDFSKIKSESEKAEKAVVKGIDDIIKALDKNENEIVKSNKDKDEDTVKINEAFVGLSSLCQSILGFHKECLIQAFSANMQATKDACAQAKEISVKVIGLNKKMTEESADLTSGYDGNGFGFIESVQLV